MGSWSRAAQEAQIRCALGLARPRTPGLPLRECGSGRRPYAGEQIAPSRKRRTMGKSRTILELGRIPISRARHRPPGAAAGFRSMDAAKVKDQALCSEQRRQQALRQPAGQSPGARRSSSSTGCFEAQMVATAREEPDAVLRGATLCHQSDPAKQTRQGGGPLLG